MKMQAVGLVETLGSASAVMIVDKMLKTSQVSYECWNTKCGGHVTVFLSGDVSAVTSAVEAVKANRLELPTIKLLKLYSLFKFASSKL